MLHFFHLVFCRFFLALPNEALERYIFWRDLVWRNKVRVRLLVETEIVDFAIFESDSRIATMVALSTTMSQASRAT